MSFSWKTARNIMRKDQGISSDVQRLEELISLVFLRIYDALEEEWEDEAENDGREFNFLQMKNINGVTGHFQIQTERHLLAMNF
nr:hypothetical protein [uncultured Treponema sp.]